MPDLVASISGVKIATLFVVRQSRAGRCIEVIYLPITWFSNRRFGRIFLKKCGAWIKRVQCIDASNSWVFQWSPQAPFLLARGFWSFVRSVLSGLIDRTRLRSAPRFLYICCLNGFSHTRSFQVVLGVPCHLGGYWEAMISSGPYDYGYRNWSHPCVQISCMIHISYLKHSKATG